MSSEAKHTPTPYECSNRDFRGEPHPHNWYITGDRREPDKDGESATCVSVAVVLGNATAGDIPEQTARFLCRAANNHAALLAACKKMLRFEPERQTPAYAIHEFTEAIRAAIAKAEGATP